MAWRFPKYVVSGEIDNRVKDRVTGYLELSGPGGRIELDLIGNAHPDLAGSFIRFRNPSPLPFPEDGSLDNLDRNQSGLAGDITASRRVKDLLVPVREYMKMDPEEQSRSCRWVNCLYIEWYSRRNGRVVLEGPAFEVEWVEGPVWKLSEGEAKEQAEQSARAMQDFLASMATEQLAGMACEAAENGEEVSPAEAAIDAETARMDLLNDRIGRRLLKEGPEAWDRIYEEESARLRRERGEPEPPPLTPEEEAERESWIEEFNAAAMEAAEDAEAEGWKEEEHADHPLVVECREFALELRRSENLPKDGSHEHPLWELANGVLFASGKLAGALNGSSRRDEWPPDELSAPSILVFLKKARVYLTDAMRGLEAAEADGLGTVDWLETVRDRLTRLIASTQGLIMEVRQSLPEEDSDTA